MRHEHADEHKRAATEASAGWGSALSAGTLCVAPRDRFVANSHGKRLPGPLEGLVEPAVEPQRALRPRPPSRGLELLADRAEAAGRRRRRRPPPADVLRARLPPSSPRRPPCARRSASRRRRSGRFRASARSARGRRRGWWRARAASDHRRVQQPVVISAPRGRSVGVPRVRTAASSWSMSNGLVR